MAGNSNEGLSDNSCNEDPERHISPEASMTLTSAPFRPTLCPLSFEEKEERNWVGSNACAQCLFGESKDWDGI